VFELQYFIFYIFLAAYLVLLALLKDSIRKRFGNHEMHSAPNSVAGGKLGIANPRFSTPF